MVKTVVMDFASREGSLLTGSATASHCLGPEQVLVKPSI